jgi:hypothetical protein
MQTSVFCKAKNAVDFRLVRSRELRLLWEMKALGSSETSAIRHDVMSQKNWTFSQNFIFFCVYVFHCTGILAVVLMIPTQKVLFWILICPNFLKLNQIHVYRRIVVGFDDISNLSQTVSVRWRVWEKDKFQYYSQSQEDMRAKCNED